jgi:hypothetical protein
MDVTAHRTINRQSHAIGFLAIVDERPDERHWMTAIEFAQRAVSDFGVVWEGVCALSFVVSGNARRLPLVVSYLAYQCLTDALLLVIGQTNDFWPALVVTTYAGYILEALAVSEVVYLLFANSVAGKTSLRWWIGSCIIFSGLAAILMTHVQSYRDFGTAEQKLLLIDQGVSIFRVLIFLAVLPFLRSRTAGHNAVVARVILVFSTYAFCALFNQVLNEVAPKLALPAGTFEWGNCACGFIWVVLLVVLSWQVLHCIAASREPRATSNALTLDESH